MPANTNPAQIEQGIHDGIPMDVYLSDPCAAPALSTGVVKNLLYRTPLHAKHDHPVLGSREDDSTPRSDLGSAAHAMLLGGDPVVYVDAKDWRTKAAQEARKEIRAQGGIPMLEKQREALDAMLAVSKPLLDSLGPGDTEQTVIAQVNGVWRRSRNDWLSKHRITIVDYKTTTDADQGSWIKTTLGKGGYDIQAGLALQSLEAICGKHERDWIWLLQEIDAAYACSFVGMGTEMADLASRKIDIAAAKWHECLTSGEWPGYSTDVYWADTTPWAKSDFETRESLMMMRGVA